jgi:FkbM family methyltransferase
MFSQRDEEKYIVEFFERFQGRFLDIGAYDGKTFSNTRQLALAGWRGVLVEPSPSLHKVLKKRYPDESRFQIVKKGIGSSRGILPFYNFGGDAVSSFDKDHAILWEEKGKRSYTTLQIEVITVEDLLNQVGFDFDFINVDTEGWSWDILKTLPFDKLHHLRLICVEYDNRDIEIREFMGPRGWNLLHRTAENLIFYKV